MCTKTPSGESPRQRRILIVDDHPLLRRGLAALINNEPDLAVCAEAATQRDGLEAVAATRPDLVIADLSLGDGDGVALVRDIHSRHADLPILVFSMHDAPADKERAFQAGAHGYVTKRQMGDTLLLTIHALLEGQCADMGDSPMPKSG